MCVLGVCDSVCLCLCMFVHVECSSHLSWPVRHSLMSVCVCQGMCEGVCLCLCVFVYVRVFLC